MKLITGMHRSGTSIVARLVFESGGDLGNPEKFYPGDKWNPDGYFEQPDFHSINMPLINGNWGKLSYFHLPSEKLILKRSEKFRDRIQEISDKYKNKIVKETRFCLTFPAWKLYGAKIDRVLINIREPIEVANSLKKRNRIPIFVGLNLWYEHNKRLLKYTEDIPKLFLNYHRLLDESYSFYELKRVLEFLDVDSDDDKIKRMTGKFINPAFNHNRVKKFDYDLKIGNLWEELKRKYLASIMS